METRTYPIPPKYVGKDLALIETPGKRPGRPKRAMIVGVVRFDRCFQYETKAVWAADYKRHQVPPDDADYGWNPKKEKWGWEVGYIRWLITPVAPTSRGITFRSGCRIP